MKPDTSEQIAMREELNQLRTRIQHLEKLESIGQLAGGVAHEFNNVLAGIIGLSELALRNIPENNHAYGLIKKIIQRSDDSASIVRQLLAFTRNSPALTRTINLNPLITSNTRVLERYLGENIDIIVRLDQDLFPIQSDPAAIDQIITNLCINARDAMPDGGQIEIRSENIVLTENHVTDSEIIPQGTYVRLTIEDNGIGMAGEVIQRMFEPFFTTKEIGYGTGLGLFIVHRIIRQHDGYISCHSEPGEGSRFEIYFPACLNTPDTGLKNNPDLFGTGNETLLIVDHDNDILDSLKDSLSGFGYTIHTARDGAEALALFEAHKDGIDLIISDIVMPVMGGIELKLIAQRINPSVKMLLISSHGEMAEPDTPFLHKPFRLERLLKKIRLVLDGRMVESGSG